MAHSCLIIEFHLYTTSIAQKLNFRALKAHPIQDLSIFAPDFKQAVQQCTRESDKIMHTFFPTLKSADAMFPATDKIA